MALYIKNVGKSEGATFFVWSFDNGDYSFEENPTYNFNNIQNYNVSLTATNDIGSILITAYKYF